jgi:hypothetical protein
MITSCQWHQYKIFLMALFLALTACTQSCSPPPPTVCEILPDLHYQTIEGWGATLPILDIPFDQWLENPTPDNYDQLPVGNSLPDDLRKRLINAAVNDMGLNRFRLEIGPQVELVNDNDDPNTTNASAYRFKWQDHLVTNWILPLQDQLAKRGEKMVLYINFDLRSSLTPDWLLNPDEYAEMALTTLHHLKDNYGLEPDYWSVLNEPGNRRPGSPKLVAQLISATGKRIRAAGFRTLMSGPEVVTPGEVPYYLQEINNTPDALEYLGQITYHLYRDPKSIRKRNTIRQWSHKLGLPAAQTEWLEGEGLETAEILFLDLTEADAVAWEQYGLCWTANRYNKKGGGDYFIIQNDYSDFFMNINSQYLRHFMQYVRPGDTRIGITCSDSAVKPVAFRKPDGRTTVVVINHRHKARDVQIKNLAPGSYYLVVTNKKNNGLEMASRVISPGQDLDFQLPAHSIITLYSTN